MKKVIDLLKQSNRKELAELFQKTDWFLRLVTNMTSEVAEKFIQDMCECEELLDEPEYAIFAHKVYGNRGLAYEFRALELEEKINPEEACVPKIQGLSHKVILSAYVSDAVTNSKEMLKYLLIEVLHAMYGDVFAEEILEKLGFDDEGNEQKKTEENEEADLTEEENEAFLDIMKRLIDLEYICMQRELKTLLDELETGKAESGGNA